MKSIVFQGVKYTKSNGKNYYYNTANRKHLHQAVWEYHNGEIPNGYHIHHVDFDKDNNDISNLRMMEESEHLKLHMSLLSDERKQSMRDNLTNNARPKASEWHGSKEGIEWHKTHYEKYKDKLHVKAKYKCEECGEPFEAINNGSNRFCSNKCKSRWRRNSGLDDIMKKCVVCGNGFKTNKYSKTETCSRSCGCKLRWINMEAE